MTDMSHAGSSAQRSCANEVTLTRKYVMWVSLGKKCLFSSLSLWNTFISIAIAYPKFLVITNVVKPVAIMPEQGRDSSVALSRSLPLHPGRHRTRPPWCPSSKPTSSRFTILTGSGHLLFGHYRLLVYNQFLKNSHQYHHIIPNQ